MRTVAVAGVVLALAAGPARCAGARRSRPCSIRTPAIDPQLTPAQPQAGGGEGQTAPAKQPRAAANARLDARIPAPRRRWH